MAGEKPMTEAEWLACTDPQRMLSWLRTNRINSERKLRLFSVACCTRVANLVPDALGRYAILVAERYADKCVSEKEFWSVADRFCPCGVYNVDYNHPATRATHYALYYQTVDQAAAQATIARK